MTITGKRFCVLVFASSIAACGPAKPSEDAGTSDASVAASCPGGSRPSILACERSLYAAQCGGDGTPRLGCDSSGGNCLWFVDGCVASEYEASDCPAANICCHAGSAGPWAFANDWQPSQSSLAVIAIEDIGAIGGGVVDDHSPSNIEVSIDPSIVDQPVASTCSGDFAYAICPLGSTVPRAFGSSIVIALPTYETTGLDLVLEVLDTDDGLVARAFPHFTTDAGGSGPPSCEQSHTHEAPPISGTLVLSAFSLANVAETHGRAVLHVAGATANVTF